jgi:hypothetical protein
MWDAGINRPIKRGAVAAGLAARDELANHAKSFRRKRGALKNVLKSRVRSAFAAPREMRSLGSLFQLWDAAYRATITS